MPVNINFGMYGANEVSAELENRFKASSQACRDVLEDYAYSIQELAKAQAPEKSGDLTESIEAKKLPNAGFGRRNTWVIYVDGDALNSKGRRIGFYAGIRHDSIYNLGPGSVQKDRALKRNPLFRNASVGRGYLSKAVEFYYDDILKELRDASRNELTRRRRIARKRRSRL